jgi:hypothetical protein
MRALINMSPGLLLQYLSSNLIQPVLCSLMIVLLGAGFVVASETDDSSLFVEAFTAYQKKDYLLAIDKIGVINQLYPDTPLQDVTLLLLARSGLKSGDNELAARTISRFNSEFATNPLKATIEEELLRLGSRWQKGEKLPPAIPLRTAAQKVRNEQLALVKVTREDVRVSISVPGDAQTVAVGQRGAIPFEIATLGTSDEGFVLETGAPPGFEAMLTVAGRTDEPLSRVTVGTVAPVKGSITFRMPTDKVDGHRSTISLRAVSEKFRHVVQIRETQVITSAPLVRVVARPEKRKLAPGERTRYHVAVLNAGSLPARELDVRVLLPDQIEFMGGGGSGNRESGGTLLFKVDTLDTGKLAEFTMEVKVREDCPIGQELRSKVEVVNNQMQTKDIFTSAIVVVQAE